MGMEILLAKTERKTKQNKKTKNSLPQVFFLIQILL